MSERHADTRCEMCKTQLTIMKRCSRCKSVLYCSHDCQMKHWQFHKSACQSEGASNSKETNDSHQNTSRSQYQTDDHSIFEDDADNSEAAKKKLEGNHPPLVDFSKAVKKPKEDTSFAQPEGKFYVNCGKFYTDVPETDETLPLVSVTVKCHKEKHKLSIQKSWSGEEVFKFLSYSLKIPLEKIKLIHKGKILNQDTVCEKIENKAVFQVIGEMAESEEGVDQRDISCMMKQMGLDRNAAIKVLRNKGDLIDALLDQ